METRLLTLHQVEDLTGFRRAFLYKEMAAGRFPRPVKIGPKAVRWEEMKVHRWIQDQIQESEQRGAQ